MASFRIFIPAPKRAPKRAVMAEKVAKAPVVSRVVLWVVLWVAKVWVEKVWVEKVGAAKVGVTAEARVEAMKEDVGARKEESRHRHLHHYLHHYPPTGPSLPGLKRCTRRNVFTKRTVTRTRAARAALAARWWW